MPNENAHSINMPPLRELFQSLRARPILEAELEQLQTEVFSPQALDRLRDEQAFIGSEFKKHEIPLSVDIDQLERNFEFLKANSRKYVTVREHPGPEPTPTNPEQRQYSSMVRVNVYEDGRISLANKLPFEVVIKEMYAVSEYGVKRSLRTLDSFPSRLPATGLRERPQIVFMQVPELAPDARIDVVVENPHTGQVLTEQQGGRLWYLDEKDYLSTSPLLKTATQPDWIVASDKQWQIPAGTRQVDQPVIVPEGVTLVIEAGAHLEMAPDTYILVRAPLNMLGDAENPVTIEGQGGALWGGIYVVNPAGRSVWRHAVIRQMNPFGFEHFSLTGATNFYRANVSLQNVLIERVEAEDGINTIESEVAFDHLKLRDTISDGYDSDYSTGTVEHSEFDKIGGDAIDTSGSRISVADVAISNIHDKAVSAGEASTLTLHGLRIQAVGVGVAAKDYSRVTADDLDIRQAELAAVMAYTKKPEYGGSYVQARKVAFDGKSELAICQVGSNIDLDGVAVKPRKVDVEYLYGQGIMKK